MLLEKLDNNDDCTTLYRETSLPTFPIVFVLALTRYIFPLCVGCVCTCKYYGRACCRYNINENTIFELIIIEIMETLTNNARRHENILRVER